MTTITRLYQFLSQQVQGFDAQRPIQEQLNSLEIFTLIGAVEKHFGVRFYSIELNEENLRSVESLAALIDQHLAPK